MIKPKLKKIPLFADRETLLINKLIPPLTLYQNVPNNTKEIVNIDIINSEAFFCNVVLKLNNNRYLKFNNINQQKIFVPNKNGADFIC